MFRFTRKQSSGSHSQYLAKLTHLFQCGYTEVVQTLSVRTSVRPLLIHIELSVILAKSWVWLPDDGFLVNRNMLEQPT
jgi:hypothetical protein